MSRASRSRRKEKRDKEKRSRKAAQKAKYQAFRDAGNNQKSKRFRKNAKMKSTLSTVSHPHGKCGNPGCTRCFGFFFSSFLDENGVPRNMPHRMWLAWQRKQKEAA